MRITAKGQVTFSQDVRERAGLMPGTDVEFEIGAAVSGVSLLARDARRYASYFPEVLLISPV